ncbi:MAG: hypothetical protein U9Q40_03600 [Campylobacterota bacterium]|nr:hypothetical protein [Campylobacterota bacterium]
MSKLLDVPDRTLRDWKKNRSRLYQLLKSTEYQDAKKKINVSDINDIVEFNPSDYTYNLFWQTNQVSKQKVYSIISNYLSSMNYNDVKTLCFKYGKTMVKSVLNDKYKKMYAKGYISTNGMDIPLLGSYNKNELYKRLIGIINDC